MKKVGIVIGHTERYQGYDSPYLPPEWVWNKAVGIQLEKLGYDIIYHNASNKYYTQRQKTTARKTSGYKYLFELHYNSAPSNKANGTECFHYVTSKMGKLAAMLVAQEISKNHGTKLRGEGGSRALYSHKDRGYGFVAIHKPYAVVVEPFFGNNRSDVNKFNCPKEYAKTLHSAFQKLP